MHILSPSTFSRFLSDEEGATAIEYGFICSLIFLVILASVTLFAGKTTAMWTLISTRLAH